MHLFVVDVAELLHQVEDGLWLPAMALHHRAEAVGQNTREVFDQASAGDVGHALDGDTGVQSAAYGRDVIGVRVQQDIGEMAPSNSLRGSSILKSFISKRSLRASDQPLVCRPLERTP